MKLTYILIFLLLMGGNLNAQITLDQTSYTKSPIGFDTTRAANGGPPLFRAVPSFPPDTAAWWDFLSLVYDTYVYPEYYVSAPAPYNYADSINDETNTFPYATSVLTEINSNGIIEYGEHINRQKISLSKLTLADPTDSIIFPEQTDMYSSPHTLVKFPATYHTGWRSSYNDTVNFNITYAWLGYSNTPGMRVTTVTETDSVYGWGKLSVRDQAGNVSGHMDVLQVVTVYQRLDSILIDGAPAPATILADFNILQGYYTNIFVENFYRPNEVTPLASVYYDEPFFVTPDSVKIHTQRLQSSLTAQNLTTENNISVYPNPVSNHSVFINNLPSSKSNNWSYDLINIAGETITSQPISASSKQVRIALDPALTPGVYYLSLKNNGLRICVKPLNIIN